MNAPETGPEPRGAESDAGDSAVVVAALTAARFIAPGQTRSLTPLAGGVSSDVFRLELADGRIFAVKRSIPRMRVKALWTASPDRVSNEVAWLRAARDIDRDLAPEVVFEVPDAHVFVMAYLDPVSHPVWKSELAAGRVDVNFAAAVGRALSRLHAATAGRPDITERFVDRSYFHDLRVEPFLLFPAQQHPQAREALEGLAAGLGRRAIALVHGDVSPKNILVGARGPVFLDSETAVFGDPAFDLAFCLSHLLLKALWVREHQDKMAQAFAAFRQTYAAGVDWEPLSDLEARAAPLLAALLLARVDGRSPAPYLSDPDETDFVRQKALRLLDQPDLTLDSIAASWRAAAAALPPRAAR